MNDIERELNDTWEVVFDDVKDQYVPLINSRFFKTRMVTRIYSITVSDNTAYPYQLIKFPRDIFIHTIKNAVYSRLKGVSVTYDSTISEVSTVATTRSNEDHTLCYHGNDFLIETESEERTIYLECLISEKNESNLNVEIYDNFLYSYYYAYTESFKKLIDAMRRTSEVKNNVLAQKNNNNAKIHFKNTTLKVDWTL